MREGMDYEINNNDDGGDTFEKLFIFYRNIL
jgi:hypothetical protein